ncbi:DUF6087 family protein [Streptomyces avicenniae]|uniref:DUF6087 family protein n=1 Tax=Streptomyces avicenniae TaxID=500153 RepID=UPI00069B30CA|nr:DUF6087 family protein [Streptomyces avicenniae]
MDEEPLAAWAARRESRRNALYRVVTLTPGPRAGAHVRPEAPRLVCRWNGYEWEAVAVAADLAETQRILYPDTAGTDPFAPRGREREGRPRAAAEDE